MPTVILNDYRLGAIERKDYKAVRQFLDEFHAGCEKNTAGAILTRDRMTNVPTDISVDENNRLVGVSNWRLNDDALMLFVNSSAYRWRGCLVFTDDSGYGRGMMIPES